MLDAEIPRRCWRPGASVLTAEVSAHLQKDAAVRSTTWRAFMPIWRRPMPVRAPVPGLQHHLPGGRFGSPCRDFLALVLSAAPAVVPDSGASDAYFGVRGLLSASIRWRRAFADLTCYILPWRPACRRIQRTTACRCSIVSPWSRRMHLPAKLGRELNPVGPGSEL